MKPSRKEVCDAAYAGDLKLLRELAARGADLNEIESGEESLLKDVISDLNMDAKPYRYAVVRTLLDLGSDPNILGEENSGPLTPAMFSMDTKMLRVLLEAGADPNRAGGFFPSESFYDWAEFDYQYQVYDGYAPDIPTEADKKDADAWLQFLDRIAIKNNVRRPDHLFLLRRFGAKTMVENGKAITPQNGNSSNVN